MQIKETAMHIVVAKNGLEGFEHLRGEHGFAKIRRPYVILLDINMPKMNGFEFLEELRKDDELKDSVVFVFSTSESDEDVIRAYEKNIAGYLVKSQAGDDFMKLAELPDTFGRSVELPSKPDQNTLEDSRRRVTNT